MRTKISIRFLLILLLFVSIFCNKSQSHNDQEVQIDCPLRKQGINAHSLKPFKEIKKYIEFLEKEDRAIWQKPGLVVSSLGLKGSETIADIGAGSGYFSFRFASELPKGKVIAIDTEPEMIRHIHHKSKASGIKNIEVVYASHDDPKVPSNVDVVFICDVLHHVKDLPRWLLKLNSEMRKGAKLVVIEFKEGNLPEGPPEKMKISSKKMLSRVSDAGFKLTQQKLDLLPYQYYYEFTK
ncbi:MAG: class I SAM-dependent methyltransferase [bacterium]|nr:class I SAM-dependent methyltransferase [bacterium]